MKVKNRIYFTLYDVLYNHTPSFNFKRWDNSMLNLPDLISIMTSNLVFPSSFITDFTNIKELWLNIYSRYYDEFIGYVNVDDLVIKEEVFNAQNLDIIQPIIDDFFSRVISILMRTYPKFNMMIKFYKNNESKLLDKIQVVSTGDDRFNDTPQEAGDFSSDEHTTNITKSTRTTSSDANTLMARLNEIQTQYRNLMADWVSRFERAYIEEINI